jgi:microcystin-dependent protein
MEVYIGTIQPFAFNFAPYGWALCAGQLMSVPQYGALFSLINTTYGGDGQNTFALPDQRGRAILGQGVMPGGSTYVMGEEAGTEHTTLLPSQMPAHTHLITASAMPATSHQPASNMMLGAASGSDPTSGDSITVNIYGPGPATAVLSPSTIGVTGGSQPFSIMQPYLVVNYSIAIQGIYPSRN